MSVEFVMEKTADIVKAMIENGLLVSHDEVLKALESVYQALINPKMFPDK